MRKAFMLMAIMLMGVMCMNSCKCTSDKQSTDVAVADSTFVDSTFTVEHTIALDRQAMFLNHANDYRWFETCVQLNDFLDEECDGSFNLVVNIFQVIETYSETSFDTYVYKYQHVDGETHEESIHGFWIEDQPLNEEAIKVTFAEAFEKVMEVNLPKPHTRQVVLRKEVGAVEANPQWIFGNSRSQIYVDAVTGEVSKDNPAYRGLNIGTPLGEWP